jgi:hypothetical protein
VTPKPRFLNAEAPPLGTLIVDCQRTDGVATWSHWIGAPELPPAWRADTSTGQVCRALANNAQACADFTWVGNDHMDCDGLLAVACACRGSDVLRYGDLLADAAACGDFAACPNEAALRLCWRLHQVIHDYRATGDGWEQRCLDATVEHLPQLIAEASEPDPQRDEAWQRVVAARERIRRQDGIRCDRLGDLVTLHWQAPAPHTWDQFLDVPHQEPWPMWAFADHWPLTTFFLFAESHPTGTIYVGVAPLHSWAATVERPRVGWPDVSRALLRLQSQEQMPCTWVGRPAATSVAFTAQMASVDADGLPAPSSLPLATVAAAFREALRAR